MVLVSRTAAELEQVAAEIEALKIEDDASRRRLAESAPGATMAVADVSHEAAIER